MISNYLNRRINSNLYQSISIWLLVIVIISLLIALTFSFGLVVNQSVIDANKPVGFITKGKLFVQEISLKNKYLTGIDLLTATWGRKNTNTNELVILNSEYKIIYRKHIVSIDIPENKIYSIKFNRSLFDETENKIYIGFYSQDGDENNSITIWTDSTSNLGSLYSVSLNNKDFKGSIQSNMHNQIAGSLCFKTYESSFLESYKSTLIYLLISILVLIAVLIILLKYFKINLKVIIKPEKLFLIFSVTFGLSFLLISPPLSGPDEAGHFFRSYQVSQLNIFKINQTIPESLLNVFRKLYYFPNKKTKLEEIISLNDINLNQEKQIDFWTYDSFVPYIPQALGIAIGKTIGIQPIGLHYLGRLFNLLFAIILIYYAIKITPIGKWLFFLISLMPMSIYLMASLSHDSMIISLSFLIVSTIFKFSLGEQRIINSNNTIIFFIMVFMLALCKPPYFLIAILFFIIPLNKFETKRKYFLVISVLMLILLFVNPSWYFIRSLLTINPLLPIPMIYVQFNQPNPAIAFVLSDLIQFINVLINDIFINNTDFYITSFFGTLGWLELPLPTFLSKTFILLAILIIISTSSIKTSLNWKKKILIFIVFIVTTGLIELASYLYFTPYGSKFINGVQGRYFIPISILFFFLFYGLFSKKTLNKTVQRTQNKFVMGEKKINKINGIVNYTFNFYRIYLIYISICFSFTTLLYSVLLTYSRYYL